MVLCYPAARNIARIYGTVQSVKDLFEELCISKILLVGCQHRWLLDDL